ncbi:MAG: ComEA family DNA-binding protein [Betaproteobacteria bacterium]|nr:ComEA family DNA-binding protein [Betaproteobacteria bacterium]
MKRFLLLLVGLIFSGLALAAVNVNTATKEELEVLNGIGPVKAQAIIDHRTANGRFKSLDDVKNVKGIGDATFDKIKGDLSLTGPTKLPAGAAAPAKAEAPKAAAAAPAAAKAEAPKAAAAAAPAAAKAGSAEGCCCGGPACGEGRSTEGCCCGPRLRRRRGTEGGIRCGEG